MSYWNAFVILVISCTTLIWSILTSWLKPTQWLTPINKCILITGCDSGIGLEMAKYLYRKGSIIIATVLSSDSFGANELKKFKNSDGRIYLIEMDIKSIINNYDVNESIEKIRKILIDNNLVIHAIINNAGICIYSEFIFQTIKQINEQLLINLMGTINFIKLLLPLIIKSNDGGRIINISSVNAMIPFPGLSVYSATKLAIECFTDCLMIELNRFNKNLKTVSLRLGDFAKHTDIMKNHEKIMLKQLIELQKNDVNFNDKEKDYFHRYHQSVMKNYGFFSPKSIEQSTLFQDLDEACFAVNPRRKILCAIIKYKLFLYFLYYLPYSLRCNFFNFIQNLSLKNF